MQSSCEMVPDLVPACVADAMYLPLFLLLGLCSYFIKTHLAEGPWGGGRLWVRGYVLCISLALAAWSRDQHIVRALITQSQ